MYVHLKGKFFNISVDFCGQIEVKVEQWNVWSQISKKWYTRLRDSVNKSRKGSHIGLSKGKKQ